MAVTPQKLPHRKKMEKPRKMKTNLCMPRLRISSCTTKNNSNRLSPMLALIERFREAVFRLIMLSALSKASTNHPGSAAGDGQRFYNPADPHHSEAVADCIEFIKRSASADENGGSDSSGSVDAAGEVVIPLPVM